MENEIPVQQDQPTTLPLTVPSDQSQSKKRNLLYIVGGILLLILVGSGAYVYGMQQGQKPVEVTQQIPPTLLPTSEAKISGMFESKPEMTLFAEKGYSFYYPTYLRLIQGLENGNLWKGKENDPKEYVIKVLLIRHATTPFPELKDGGTLDFIKTEYPYEPDPLKVSKVTESQVKLGTGIVRLYEITSLGNTPYNIVRFESNNTYYELIAHGVGNDFLPALKQILASFSFYNPQATEWKTYRNIQGKYSVQFPPSSTLFERTYLSVDGVRGFDENMITIYPPKPVSIDEVFTITYEQNDSKTLDMYVKESQGGIINDDNNKLITVAGEPAIYAIMPGILPIPTVFIKHNNTLYKIGGTAPNGPIISTFKFL